MHETESGVADMKLDVVKQVLIGIFALVFPGLVNAAESEAIAVLNAHWAATTALVLFLVAYLLVIAEETIHLRKSKPMMVAAGIIWVLVAVAQQQSGTSAPLELWFEHNLLEFAELFLFLLAAMTYINTMEERGIFNYLRVRLISGSYTLRQIYWLTGALSFCLSPVADNLTTALLMSAVILAIAPDNRRFIVVSCINIVIAANAGGAFSPFGDITTLMVWQHGALEFTQFLALIVPALVNWLLPAIIMSFSVSVDKPEALSVKAVVKHGAWVVVALFIITIVMAVVSHNTLHLPPVLGMMTGLGFLKLFGYYLQKRRATGDSDSLISARGNALVLSGDEAEPYDIFKNLQKAEWDTLMFFYGIMMCVGGLGAFGYLALGSELLYGQLGETTANILVGFISALIDNIPVMFAVLEMQPVMSEGQWLLVTLTAGVGGSMLSIGSAAGVAVMGLARGSYTFVEHLKWSWAIALGFAASIATHMLLNAAAFTGG